MAERSAILSRDTAVIEPAVDSTATLTGLPGAELCVGDSLVYEASLERLSTEPHEIFGPDSVLANELTTTLSELATTPFSSQSVVLTSMVLLCFIGYSLILYYYRIQVYSLLSILRGKMYLNNLLVGQNLLFNHFLRLTISLGLCSLSIASFRCMTLFFPQVTEFFLNLPFSWATNILPLVPLFAVCAIWLFQSAVLQLLTRIMPNNELLPPLHRLRYLFFALATIISTPFVLFFIFSDGTVFTVLLSIYFLISIFIVIVFIIRSLVLFMEQGVSISYWILYLCAVEIFPISFFCRFSA